MAIIIHIYKFKGDDRIHLAAELSTFSSMPHSHEGYISYYDYNQSEKGKIEEQRAYKGVGDNLGACGFTGDIERYAKETDYLFRKLGFGYNSKEFDQEDLVFVNRIIIPTQEDGFLLSPYRETLIMGQWRYLRPSTLSEAIKKFGEDNIELHKFDINRRHCGTIIQNILDRESLNRPIEEKKDSETKKVNRDIIADSLQRTIQQAHNISKGLSLKLDTKSEDLENCYLKDDLRRFYSDYRKSKFFWQSESKDYQVLEEICRDKEASFIAASKIPESIIADLNYYLGKLNTAAGLVRCGTVLDYKEQPYPSTYDTIFNSEKNPVAGALALLRDYAEDSWKNNVLHCRRNHKPFIRGLLPKIEQNKYEDVHSVVRYVRDEARFKRSLMGKSLQRRLSFLSNMPSPKYIEEGRGVSASIVSKGPI